MIGGFWYACWVLFIAAALSGCVSTPVLIGACIFITLLPPKFDPAIWMKERQMRNRK